MTQSVDNETLTGTGTGTGGLAGTASNITGRGRNRRRREQVQLQARRSPTPPSASARSSVTPSVTPGAINSQHVNVVFDKSVPAATQTAVRNAVAAAVGLNAKRGDTITTGTMTLRQDGDRPGRGGLDRARW